MATPHEDLRAALKRIKSDIERQSSPPPGADPPPPPESRKADDGPALPPSGATPPWPQLRISAPPSSLPAAGAEEDPDGRPAPAMARDEPDPPGRWSWPQVVHMLGLGTAAAGVFMGNALLAAAGLIAALAGTAASGAHGAGGGPREDLSDLALRVAALERRLSSLDLAASSGSMSREVEEEVKELRRILMSLLEIVEKNSEP